MTEKVLGSIGVLAVMLWIIIPQWMDAHFYYPNEAVQKRWEVVGGVCLIAYIAFLAYLWK